MEFHRHGIFVRIFAKKFHKFIFVPTLTEFCIQKYTEFPGILRNLRASLCNMYEFEFLHVSIFERIKSILSDYR